MAQYQLTVEGDLLTGLFTRSEAVAELVEQVLNQILAAQASDQLRAEPYQRTEDRQGYRNGYRERALTTRFGSLVLEVPRIRGGALQTEIFARYQRSEQALLITLVEMVVSGVSTRKVKAVTEELCGAEISRSTVSDLCKRLDPIVQAWNERDLAAQTYPFVLVDALVIRVRNDGRVRQQSVLIATGINALGYREILGMQLGDSESEATWGSFFAWLKGRGLTGVDLVVSDDHAGLVKAVQLQFQGASWQRCQTHATRNLCDACPKTVWPELHPRLRLLFTAPDLPTARSLLTDVLHDFEARAPKAMALLEAAFDDLMAVMALPAPYRKRLRTTNGPERLNEEVRRRERVIRIFPNSEAAQRLLGAVLQEIDEAWTTGHRYFDMTEYWAWRARSTPEEAMCPIPPAGGVDALTAVA
jgi:transposase-like protein